MPKSFYNRNTLQVAQDLLGCFLVRKIKGKIIKAKIVEVEAYKGLKDLASHASRGRTRRNNVMFGEPGIIYVYLVYGMHYMLNFVTEKKDYPAAVLIRAVALPRPRVAGRACEEKSATNGPAKLTKFLQIDQSFNNLPVYARKYGFWVEGRNINFKLPKIIKTTRIGVDYARKYKNKKWRFYIIAP